MSFLFPGNGIPSENGLVISVLQTQWLMVSINEKQWFSQYTPSADRIKMASFIDVGRMIIMKTLRLFKLLFALTILTSCAQMNPSVIVPKGIASNDHEALVQHYENLAREAKIRLQENKKILDAYEAHPYYYGRQGPDLQSHTSANIRAYEKALRENLRFADLHRKMAMEQRNNQIYKAETRLERDFPIGNEDYSGNKGL